MTAAPVVIASTTTTSPVSVRSADDSNDDEFHSFSGSNSNGSCYLEESMCIGDEQFAISSSVASSDLSLSYYGEEDGYCDYYHHESNDDTYNVDYVNDDADTAASDTAMLQQSQTTPPQHKMPTTSSCSPQQHDFVSTSLKRTIYQQDSELSQLLLSVNALSSTPGRIARLCNEELMRENDEDDHDNYYNYHGLVKDYDRYARNDRAISFGPDMTNDINSNSTVIRSRANRISSSRATNHPTPILPPREVTLASSDWNPSSTGRLGSNLVPHTRYSDATATHQPLQDIHQSSVRGKAGGNSKMSRIATIVGEENRPLLTNGRRVTAAEIGLSRSPKQPFAMKTRAPYAKDGPVMSLTKDTKSMAPAPPSFLLSRRLSSPQLPIKSTTGLEGEGMERMKTSKVQTILDSTTSINSRYKATMKQPMSAPSSLLRQSRSKIDLLTAPKPPSYHRNPQERSTLYKPTRMRKRVQTFGETVHHYLNHGLRNGSLPSPPIQQLIATAKPTSLMKSSLRQSSKVIEHNERWKKSHARTFIGIDSTPHCRDRPLLIPPPQKQDLPKTLTSPSPFRLHTHYLPAKSIRPPLPSRDDIELSKQFRALPLPKSHRYFHRRGAIDTTSFCALTETQHELAKQRTETLTKGGSSNAINSPYKRIAKQSLPSTKAIDPTSLLRQPKSTFGFPTAPKPPPYHRNRRERSALYKPTLMRKRVQTFGEIAHHYLNHGLRDGSLPNPPIQQLIATAKPPSFLRC